MIIVHTRQNRYGNWWCNATIKGYEVSVEGNSVEDARLLMFEELHKRDIEKAYFMIPLLYPLNYKKPQINYTSSRLDNL